MTRREPSRRDTAAAAIPLAAMVLFLLTFASAIWLLIDHQVDTLQASATVPAPVVEVVDATQPEG